MRLCLRVKFIGFSTDYYTSEEFFLYKTTIDK